MSFVNGEKTLAVTSFRWLNIMLFIVALFLLFSSVGYADSTIASGQYGSTIGWELDNEGKLTITGTGAMPDYSYTNEDLRPWYDYAKQVSSISIDEGISHIGGYAFGGFSMLSTCEIPESVTTIGSRAFWECTNLTTIELPSQLTRIEESTFYGCKSLQQINFPDGLTYIGRSAFQGTGLISLVFPECIDTIGDYAFHVCFGLGNVFIPKNASNVSDITFYNSSAVVYMYADSKAADNFMYKESGDTISGAFRSPSEPEYIIHKVERDDGTTYLTIGDYVGEKTEIVLPSEIDGIRVRAVEGYAFQKAKQLISVWIPDGYTSIKYLAFYTNQKLCSVRVPATVTSINQAFDNRPTLQCYEGSYAHQWAIENDCPVSLIDGIGYEGKNTLILPAQLSVIESEAFANNSDVEIILVPDSIKEIQSRAFANCISLESVFVYNPDVVIMDNAFSGCPNVIVVYY